jgi:curli biogenesis system outer membrane secretion channel CsgG
MNRRQLVSLIFAAAIITGCGSTNTVRQALPQTASGNPTYQIADISSKSEEVPAKFEKDLRKYLEEDLEKKGMLGNGAESRKVSVEITEFSMSQGGSRLLLGALAGKDYVKAEVNVVDAASNELIGSSTIESKDRLAGGGPELFTSYHAKAISKFLQGKN